MYIFRYDIPAKKSYNTYNPGDMFNANNNDGDVEFKQYPGININTFNRVQKPYLPADTKVLCDGDLMVFRDVVKDPKIKHYMMYLFEISAATGYRLVLIVSDELFNKSINDDYKRELFESILDLTTRLKNPTLSVFTKIKHFKQRSYIISAMRSIMNDVSNVLDDIPGQRFISLVRVLRNIQFGYNTSPEQLIERIYRLL